MNNNEKNEIQQNRKKVIKFSLWIIASLISILALTTELIADNYFRIPIIVISSILAIIILFRIINNHKLE
jgi:predicted ferric reductase